MSDSFGENPLPDVKANAAILHEWMGIYQDAGFTREESFELVRALVAGIRTMNRP
jgi:hypothetical protein